MNQKPDKQKPVSEQPKQIKHTKQHNNTNTTELFINPNENLRSRVEIPFSFQHDKQTSDKSGEQTQGNNQLHSFIKINNIPTWYLDISSETNQEKLISEGLNSENLNLKRISEKWEKNLVAIQSENDKQKAELIELEQESLAKNQQWMQLIELLNTNEVMFNTQILNNKIFLQKTDTMIKNWIYNFEELQDKGVKTGNNTIENNSNSSINTNNYSEEEMLKKKFEVEECDDTEVKTSLLHDITDFMKFQKWLTDNKRSSVEQVINIIKEQLQDLNLEITWFGSYGSDTACDWSNVNFLLTFSEDNLIDPETLIQVVYMKIKDLPFILDIDIINNAELNTLMHSSFKQFSNWTSFTPRIQFYSNEQYNNLSFELNLQMGNTQYYTQTLDLVNQYKEKFPIFKPLLISLKHWLHNCSLLSNSDGNWNTYSLTILWINYLISRDTVPTWSEAFWGFLKFYGNSSDKSSRTISIHNNISTDILNMHINSNHELIVIDPFNHNNNIAEKTFKYENVKVAFIVAYFTAKYNCECSCHYDNKIVIQETKSEYNVWNKIFKAVKRWSNVNMTNSSNDS